MSSESAIPIAIVGLGFGRWVIKSLQRAHLRKLFRIVAICDLDRLRAAEIARETGAVTATFDELLAAPGIPVIGLFTGPVGRADLIRKIIRVGKDVMTTKPFERDPAAGRAVLEEAAALGRIVHLNSPTPAPPPDLACILAWREKYRLGAPVAAQFSTWARYQEPADGSWMDDPALCPVAPIFRIGIYLINDAVEIFGEPDEVQVMSSRLVTGRPTPDNAQLAIRFRNGGMVSILASFCVDDGDAYRNSLTLNFEHGTVHRNAGPGGRAGVAGVVSLIAVRDGRPALVAEARLDRITGEYQWENFHRALLSRELPPSDYPAKVAAGLRIIEAMAESDLLNRAVKIV